MAGESQHRTTILTRMSESPLVSVWRLVFVFLLALSASLLDMFYLHIVGIETLSQLASQTLIHTIGIYIGFTLAALFVPLQLSKQ